MQFSLLLVIFGSVFQRFSWGFSNRTDSQMSARTRITQIIQYLQTCVIDHKNYTWLDSSLKNAQFLLYNFTLRFIVLE